MIISYTLKIYVGKVFCSIIFFVMEVFLYILYFLQLMKFAHDVGMFVRIFGDFFLIFDLLSWK